MTDTAKLVIAVDSSGAAKATANLDGLNRAAGNSERAANKVGKAWGVAVGLISSAVIIGATRSIIRSADAFANMSAKLKLVTGSTEAATKAQRDLFALAQSTAGGLEGVTDLYVKLGQSSKDLAGNHQLLLGITEKVSKALVISGADTASATAVIRQFSQAMAAGALRGDEFVSVMEGAPRLARAIADGLGVSVGALRSLAAQGKLTSDAIIQALENQGDVLDREFSDMPLTVGRATEKVKNSLLELIGVTDQSSGATRGLATAIDGLASALADPRFQAAFRETVSWLAQVATKALQAASAIREYIGAAAKRSDVMLRNQRDDLEGKLFAAQRTSSARPGAAMAMLPGVGPLLGAVSALGAGADQERITNLKNQIAEIDAILAAREKQAADDFAKYRGLDPKFGLNVNPNGSGGGVAAHATSATSVIRQQAAATEELHDAEDDYWALQDVRDEAAVDASNRRAEAWAREGDAIGEATDKMNIYADQAARNMQDTFADFLFDPFKNGVRGMVDSFADALRRMASQVAASEIFKAIGTWASGYTGTGAGFVNAIGSAIKGGRAGGGPVMAGQSYWVGENGRELFTPPTNGTVNKAGGGVTVKQGDVHIEIVNKGEPAQARVMSRQQAPDGSQLIKVILQAVGESFSTGTGAPYMGAKQRFGLREPV